MTCDCYILFNSISVISGWLVDDNGRLCAMEFHLWLKRSLPQTGLEPGAARSASQQLTHWTIGAPQILEPSNLFPVFREITLLNFYKSRPSCSKLTTSLVNVSLKFQTLISQICQYFLLKKCEKLLQCKSFSHFFHKKYQYIWL